MNRGFGAIGVILVAAIFALLAVSVNTTHRFYSKVENGTKQITLATRLIEQVRTALQTDKDSELMRDIASSTIEIKYYLTKSDTDYRLDIEPTISLGGLVSTLIFRNVERDASFNIIDEGGTIDTRTKIVIASIYETATSTNPLVTAEFLIYDQF